MDILKSVLKKPKGEPENAPLTAEEAESEVRDKLSRSVREEPYCSHFKTYPFICPHPKRALPRLTEPGWENMELRSLRWQVFLVDPRSATPVSSLIYDEVGRNGGYELMRDFKVKAEERMVCISKDEDWEWKWEKVRVMKQCIPPNPKLRDAIDTARRRYAGILRDIDHRDIDVLYTGETAPVGAFQHDQDLIIKGVRPLNIRTYQTTDIIPRGAHSTLASQPIGRNVGSA